MDIIFPFLFLITMGVVGFVIFRQASVRKERFASLAMLCRLDMSGGGFGSVLLRGLHEGYPVVFTFTPSGKNTPPYMTAACLCQLPLTVTLRPQGITTTFKTALGLGRDLEIGDQEMDDTFEIDGAAEPGLLRFLGDQDVRAVLLNLHSRRLSELYFTEQGVSFRRVIDESELDAHFINDTTEVMHWLGVAAYRLGLGHGSDDGRLALPKMGYGELGVEALMLPESTETRAVSWSEAVVDDHDHGDDHVHELGDVDDHDHGDVQVHEHDHDHGGDHDHGDVQVHEHDHDQGDDEFERVEQLVRRLNDYQHRDEAEEALLAMGAGAVPALVAALENPILAYPVTELFLKGDEEMHRGLVAELANITDERALTKALEVCARVAPADSAEALEPFLEHESFMVRYEAERALEAVKG